MYNTEAKKLLERYGFELKEAYNDVYTFENSHGDKVIFSDDRDPVFKILENSRMQSFLNQVSLDDLRIWLVQNQTAVYSETEAYSVFKDYFEGAKKASSAETVGLLVTGAVIVGLFRAASKVFGGALAHAIADKIRKIGERPVTSDDLNDALAVVEEARNKLIKSGDKEARRAFDAEVEKILHPINKKFDSRAPRAKGYSKDNLEAYSFKESVISGLKKLRDLSADFIEEAIIQISGDCASSLGQTVVQGGRKEVMRIKDPLDRDQAIKDTADMVSRTFDRLSEDQQRELAQKVRSALDPKNHHNFQTQGPRKGGMQGHSQMEDATDMKTWLTDNKDKLGISDEFIEEITSKFDDNQIRSAVNEILNSDAEVKVN